MNLPAYTVDYSALRTKNGKKYDIHSPDGRKQYFNDKAGPQIKKLQEFLKEHTFLAFLLAPKNAGKGTYSKLFEEAVGKDLFEHVAVGDLVRAAEIEFKEQGKDSGLYKYAEENYRGYLHLDDAFDTLSGRSTTSLLQTEFILTVIKYEIEKLGKKTVFLDGFPRNLDQISYSLYFRDLVNFRQDPDIFILINAPIEVLDKRIKSRVICPDCKTSRSVKLLPTSRIGYDKEKNEFYLMCDNPHCATQPRMVAKEGDELGLEPIMDRIKMDLELMERAKKLYGIPVVELYNSLEKDKALEYADDYEFTEEYSYDIDEKGNITTKGELWTVYDNGKEYHSLYAPAVVIQLINKLCKVFDLE